MSKIIRHQELVKHLRWQKHFVRKHFARKYHLDPAEENLCLIAKNDSDLYMEVKTVPKPKENEVLIRVGGCCITNFDFECLTRFSGHHKNLVNSFVPGSFPTGVVVKIGAGVNGVFKEGDRVVLEPGISCNKCPQCHVGNTHLCPNIHFIGSQGFDGGISRFMTHPITFTHRLDDSVSLEVGTLSSKIATCINLYKRAGITKESKVLIIGSNVIGLVGIMVIKHVGVGSIFVTETNNYRLNLARNLGADYVIKLTSMESPEYPEYLKEIIHTIHPGQPDIVIDTIGTSSSLESAMNLCKSGGNIMLITCMARPVIARFYHAAMREINIMGSFSYTQSSFKEAVKLIATTQLQIQKILPVKVPLEHALDAFSFGRATGGENLFIIVSSYSETDSKDKPITPAYPMNVGVPQLKPAEHEVQKQLTPKIEQQQTSLGTYNAKPKNEENNKLEGKEIIEKKELDGPNKEKRKKKEGGIHEEENEYKTKLEKLEQDTPNNEKKKSGKTTIGTYNVKTKGKPSNKLEGTEISEKNVPRLGGPIEKKIGAKRKKSEIKEDNEEKQIKTKSEKIKGFPQQKKEPTKIDKPAGLQNKVSDKQNLQQEKQNDKPTDIQEKKATIKVEPKQDTLPSEDDQNPSGKKKP